MKWNVKPPAALLGLVLAAYCTGPASASRYPAQSATAAPQDTVPDDPAAGFEGPRGTSQHAEGEQRYDEVGFAAVGAPGLGPADAKSIVASHASLPVDSFVEVTALDTGRTILVLVARQGAAASGNLIELSPAAAYQLGVGGGTHLPVRVRRVTAAPLDRAALQSGQPAPARADAPPVLLNALRRRLPAPVVQGPVPVSRAGPGSRRPAVRQSAPVARRVPTGANLVVQVAALSNARNAQSLAQSMGGFVRRAGGLYRVQLGPFATRGEAEAARVRAVRAGYEDARVIAAN